MTNIAKRNGSALSIRLSQADIALIDRAARMRGRSRAEFVREAAMRACEEVVMEKPLIRMSEDGFAAFVATISAPVVPVPEMVELFRRKAPWDAYTDET